MRRHGDDMSFHCFRCGKKMKTIDTRPVEHHVRRRHACSCGARITTREVIIERDDSKLRIGNSKTIRETDNPSVMMP